MRSASGTFRYNVKFTSNCYTGKSNVSNNTIQGNATWKGSLDLYVTANRAWRELDEASKKIN